MALWKDYVRKGLVHAKPMTRGEYNDWRGWDTPADENKNDMGYMTEDDAERANTHFSIGYISWMEKEAFHNAHEPTVNIKSSDTSLPSIHGMELGWVVKAVKTSTGGLGFEAVSEEERAAHLAKDRDPKKVTELPITLDQIDAMVKCSMNAGSSKDMMNFAQAARDLCEGYKFLKKAGN